MKKRNRSKGLYSLLASTLCFSTLFSPYAGAQSTNVQTLVDVDAHWASTQIQEWHGKGLAKGYDDGTFKPNKNITRAEFITLVNQAFGYTNQADISFVDVPVGAWFQEEVKKAKAAGYISGYEDLTIRPYAPITRQEVAAIVSKINKLDLTPEKEAFLNQFTDAADIPNWSKSAIGAVAEKGYMNGYTDKTFMPKKSITRAEAIVTLDNILKAVPVTIFDKPGTYGSKDQVKVIKGNVIISSNITLVNTVIKGSLTIAKELAAGDVILDGVTVNGVTADASSINLKIMEGTVTQLTVSDKSKNLAIYVDPKATITTLVLNSAVKVTGKGTIQTAKVNVSGSSFEQEPKKLVLASGITATVNGKLVGNTAGGGGGGNPSVKSNEDKLKDGQSFTGNADLTKDKQTYGPADGKTATVKGNITVKADEAILRNVTIDGDLTVNNTTKKGKPLNEFTASNVEVTDETVINGGSSHTVEFEDSELEEVTLNKEGVRFAVNGDTSVDQKITVNQPAILDLDTTGTLSDVVVNASLTIVGTNGSIGSITVNEPGVQLNISSSGIELDSLKINAEGVTIYSTVDLDDIIVVEDGVTPPVVKKVSVEVMDAIVAIEAIPEIENLTLDDEEIVVTAREAVNTAKDNGAKNSDIPNLAKLEAAEAKILQLKGDKVAPEVTSISFGDIVTPVDRSNNIFDLDLRGVADHYNTLKMNVSEKSQLTLDLGQLGELKYIGLQNGVNTISDIDVSGLDISELDSGKINFTELYDAIKDSNISRRVLMDTINATEIFEEVRDSNVDASVIFDAVDFQALLEAVKEDTTTKSVLLDQLNLDEVFTAIKSSTDIDTNAIYNSIDFVAVNEAVNSDSNIDGNKIKFAIAPGLVIALQKDIISTDDLLQYQLNGDITAIINKIKNASSADQKAIYDAMIFTDIFSELEKSETDTKVAIFDSINFTQVFDTLKDASDATKKAIFNAFDFGAIFTTLRDSSLDQEIVVDAINFSAIFAEIQNSNVDRTTILNAIDLAAILDAVDEANDIGMTLFKVLANLDNDGDADQLTIRATLEDSSNNSTVYTIQMKL